jgi:hypothetical protein
MNVNNGEATMAFGGNRGEPVGGMKGWSPEEFPRAAGVRQEMPRLRPPYPPT